MFGGKGGGGGQMRTGVNQAYWLEPVWVWEELGEGGCVHMHRGITSTYSLSLWDKAASERGD